MVGVEPWCWLEVGAAVVFDDAPFADVDGPVVVRAQRRGVGFVSVAAVFPFFDVVNLGVDGGDGAAGGLATAITGEDGAALCWGE